MNFKTNVTNALSRKKITALAINAIDQLSRDNGRKLAHLETTIALDDTASLDEVGRLRTQVSLYPPRRLVEVARLESQEQELLAACAAYAHEFLSPRLRNQLEKAREITEAQLKDMFVKPNDLKAAVDKTALIQELSRLRDDFLRAKHGGDSGEDRAAALFAIHDRSESLAAKLK